MEPQRAFAHHIFTAETETFQRYLSRRGRVVMVEVVLHHGRFCGRVSNPGRRERVDEVGVGQPHGLVQSLDEHVARLRQQRRALVQSVDVDAAVGFHGILERDVERL